MVQSEIQCGNCSFFMLRKPEGVNGKGLAGSCVQDESAQQVLIVTEHTDPRELPQIKDYFLSTGDLCFRNKHRLR